MLCSDATSSPWNSVAINLCMANHAVFCLLKVFEAPLARLWALHPFRLLCVRVCALTLTFSFSLGPLLVAFSFTASVVGSLKMPIVH
ncbi:hypothetical protein EDD85DRAFT_799973 [Armillaria nabsnona]|nr:hypothetical protein EDD85DRAFT_799973 [Armillaria nabsnona]